MNRIFKLSNLLDGEYFYENKELRFDLKRCILNYFQVFVSLFIFFNHLVVFLTDDYYLKHDLVAFRMFSDEDSGERFTNMAVGISILACGWIILVYKKFHKNQSGLDTMRFLFCFDEKTMEKDFHLNSNLAKQQVKFQRIFLKGAKIWHLFYFVTLFIFVLRLAIDNLSKNEFGIYFLLKILLYLNLFIFQQASLSIVFIVFGQMNLSCIYFSKRLQSLEIKMQKFFELKEGLMDKKMMKMNRKYNAILKDQKKINYHFGQVFYFYHSYNSFTVIYPIHVLFLNPSDTFRIAYDLANYLNIIFLILLPLTVSNMSFTRANIKFMKNCYKNSPSLKKIHNKIKMFSVYTLNYDNHSISFNFKNFMNYSLYFFIFWLLESICLVILFYSTINVIKK